MAVDQQEVIELLDDSDDDNNDANNIDGDVEEVQVERAVRNAAQTGADDDDEDLVVTGAFSRKQGTPKIFRFLATHFTSPFLDS